MLVLIQGWIHAGATFLAAHADIADERHHASRNSRHCGIKLATTPSGGNKFVRAYLGLVTF